MSCEAAESIEDAVLRMARVNWLNDVVFVKRILLSGSVHVIINVFRIERYQCRER